MTATEQGITFKEAVLAEPEIITALASPDLDEVFDLPRSTGCCEAMVDRVLAEVRGWENGDVEG